MPSILITGISRGVGAATAMAFLRAGWTVHGLGRGGAPESLIGFEGFRFHRCDLRQASDIETAAAQIEGPLDVLMNNAAVFGGRAFYARDFDPAAFEETLFVNTVAPALLARLLLPRLQAGERRLIVMMSTGNASLAGNVGGEMFAYRASKSALNQIVRTMAVEWAERPLTTVALNPGWVRTDMGGTAAPLSADEAAADILRFVDHVATPAVNGAFVNTDGSALPW